MTVGQLRDREPEDPLGFALAAAARKLAKFYAAALAERPVTPAQLVVLRRLWAEDGQSLRDLAPRAGLDPTSLNWLVDQLEKTAFLTRRRDDADRRLVRVWLTDAGRALANELEPEAVRWDETVEQELRRRHTVEELTAFRAVLATIATALPEGEDLWSKRIAAWEATLAALKRSLEDDATDEAAEPRRT